MKMTENVKKVLDYLVFKKLRDDCGLNPSCYRGWATTQDIATNCYFTKNATAIGCITALKKRGIVESTVARSLNGKEVVYFRIRDGIDINVSYDFEVKNPDTNETEEYGGETIVVFEEEEEF